MSPTFLSLGFVFGEVAKIKVKFVTFCMKSLVMLDVALSQVDVGTEFGVLSLNLIFL